LAEDGIRDRNVTGVQTCALPIYQRPIEYGVDLVMHSASKYIGGHSDLIGGIVVAADAQRLQSLRAVAMATGGIQGPFDCYLALRGLKTLSVRMQRQAANAQVLAQHLDQHERVAAVFYPGLDSHPRHGLCRQQMRTGGAVVSVKLNASRLELDTFLGALRLFVLADSLGGVESMINHSWSMSHGSMPRERKLAQGITENLFRLSAGIEDAADLVADLEQALAAM